MIFAIYSLINILKICFLERKVLSHGVGIRRTGSFDMISSSSYLNGEWPKLSLPVSHVCLTCEKSTQVRKNKWLIWYDFIYWI